MKKFAFAFAKTVQNTSTVKKKEKKKGRAGTKFQRHTIYCNILRILDQKINKVGLIAQKVVIYSSSMLWVRSFLKGMLHVLQCGEFLMSHANSNVES